MPLQSRDERLWRLLLRLFSDDLELRRFLALGDGESQEIVPHLPGVGSTFAETAWRAISLLSARGALQDLIRRLADLHADCSHSAEIMALLRNAEDQPQVAAQGPAPERIPLVAGAEIDILPYLWSGAERSRWNARLMLALHGSTLAIAAFPWLLRRGIGVELATHCVGEAAAKNPMVVDACAPQRRSTYSYYPLGRGKSPAFDLTVGPRVLLVDGPHPDAPQGALRTLVVEYEP